MATVMFWVCGSIYVGIWFHFLDSSAHLVFASLKVPAMIWRCMGFVLYLCTLFLIYLLPLLLQWKLLESGTASFSLFPSIFYILSIHTWLLDKMLTSLHLKCLDMYHRISPYGTGMIFLFYWVSTEISIHSFSEDHTSYWCMN